MLGIILCIPLATVISSAKHIKSSTVHTVWFSGYTLVVAAELEMTCAKIVNILF